MQLHVCKIICNIFYLRNMYNNININIHNNNDVSEVCDLDILLYNNHPI